MEGAGNDTIMGGAYNDYLKGDVGQDKISGGAGDDLIIGGLDADTLTGGAGNDTFRFAFGALRSDSSPTTIDLITSIFPQVILLDIPYYNSYYNFLTGKFFLQNLKHLCVDTEDYFYIF